MNSAPASTTERRPSFFTKTGIARRLRRLLPSGHKNTSWKFWHCVPCFAVGKNLVGSKLPPSSCHHQNIFWRISKLSRSNNPDSSRIWKTKKFLMLILTTDFTDFTDFSWAVSGYYTDSFWFLRDLREEIRFFCFCFRSDWILKDGWCACGLLSGNLFTSKRLQA